MTARALAVGICLAPFVSAALLGPDRAGHAHHHHHHHARKATR